MAATASTYFNDVQKLYIAYYQRPADPGGLLYWSQMILARNGDLGSVVDAFVTSAESSALYGAVTLQTIGQVIDKVYVALFGRLAEPAGKQFYVDGFAAGTFTAGTIVRNILDGTQGEDVIAIMNKLNDANLFTVAVDGRPTSDANFGAGTSFSATYSGTADAVAARTWLATVNAQSTSIKTANEVVDFVRTTIADAGDPIKGTDSVTNLPLTSGSVTATAAAEAFVYPYKMVDGRPTKATAGEVIINGFDTSKDKLVFEDVGTGTVFTKAQFLALAGVVVADDPFAVVASIYFDPDTDAGVLGGVSLTGVTINAITVETLA